jgi:hypothetical protein
MNITDSHNPTFNVVIQLNEQNYCHQNPFHLRKGYDHQKKMEKLNNESVFFYAIGKINIRFVTKKVHITFLFFA